MQAHNHTNSLSEIVVLKAESQRRAKKLSVFIKLHGKIQGIYKPNSYLFIKNLFYIPFTLQRVKQKYLIV